MWKLFNIHILLLSPISSAGQDIRVEEQEGQQATEVHPAGAEASAGRRPPSQAGWRQEEGGEREEAGWSARDGHDLQAGPDAEGGEGHRSQVGGLRLLQARHLYQGWQVQVLARPLPGEQGREAFHLCGYAWQRGRPDDQLGRRQAQGGGGQEALRREATPNHWYCTFSFRLPKSTLSINLLLQICKYFLEAVEKSKYGWFWECPNGEKCIYRHALPPGYVLKRDKKKEDKPTEISLVDLIEKERAALGPNQTRVTLESFLAWKKRKLAEKKAKLAAEEERKKSDFSKGKQFGISGREMFSFNPDLVDDGPMEEGDAAFDVYKREDDDDDNAFEFKELDLAALSLAAQEVDGSGTIASETRLLDQATEAAKTAAAEEAAAPEDDGPSSSAPANDAAPINKDLFVDLADELDDLDLEDEDDD